IKVPTIDFVECLKKYGVPYYLKIDLEGMDVACLKALRSIEGRPAYVSIESEKQQFDRLVDELSLLSELGYDRFQAVQQAKVERQVVPFPAREGRYFKHVFKEGSSGLFGEELSSQWKTAAKLQMEYKMKFLGYKIFGDYGWAQKYFLLKVVRKVLSIILRRRIPGWFDTHAKHSSVADQDAFNTESRWN
ncbi:MAG: FkbM family methyltransferase, partial [Roseiarcus sp.]